MPYTITIETCTGSTSRPYFVIIAQHGQHFFTIRRFVMKHIGALKKHKHIILPEMAVKQIVFTFTDMDIIIKTRHSQQYIFYDGAFGWSKTLKQQVIDENISLSYISRYKIGRSRKQLFVSRNTQQHFLHNLILSA